MAPKSTAPPVRASALCRRCVAIRSCGSSDSSPWVRSMAMCRIRSGLARSRRTPPISSAAPLRPLAMMPISKTRSSESCGLNMLTFCARVLPRAWATEGGIAVLCVAIEPLLEDLESSCGIRGGGNAEQIAAPELAVPATKPIQALLFFLQFSQGVLADPFLVLEFGKVLVAIRLKLRPFLLSGVDVQLLQPASVLGGVTVGIQDQHRSMRDFDEFGNPLEQRSDGRQV